MRRRLALIVCLAFLTCSSAARAAQAIQGAVGNITPSQAADLKDVGCRGWSTSDPVVNANQRGINPQCVDTRCPRRYNTNPLLEPGGYICPGEDTIAYSDDNDKQTFYLLVDAQSFGDACNHAAYYSAQGLVARSTEAVTGDFRQVGCPGPTAVNCYERADARSSRRSPLTAVPAGASKKDGKGPREITSIGGLSPVPVVLASLPGKDCPDGQARLTWDEPELYKSTMKGEVATPVKGVRLYTNNNPCGTCPDGIHGWVAGDTFPVGAGSKGVCVPIMGPTWFALTVRLTGPNAIKDSKSEIETGRVGSSGFVGANSACVQPAKR